MTDDTFEGWAYKLSDIADHTWVSTNKGDFVCWGGSRGPENRKIVTGKGNNYAVANCYRKPAFGHQDTAGIIYGLNGVCHQTANLFMYPARTILNSYSVRGLIVSISVYGAYGTAPFVGPVIFFLGWLAAVYNPCYQAHANSASVAGGGADPLFDRIAELYQDTSALAANRHDHVVAETAIYVDHAGLGIDSAKVQEPQLELLDKRDSVIASGVRGQEMANRINEAAKVFQANLEKQLGAEAFQKLTGQKPGEYIGIVDPKIAEAVAKHG